MQHATGTFEVKLVPQSADEGSEGTPLARLSIDKQFHGDLEGTSKGEMLTAGTAIKNSAVYVAVERVTARDRFVDEVLLSPVIRDALWLRRPRTDSNRRRRP